MQTMWFFMELSRTGPEQSLRGGGEIEVGWAELLFLDPRHFNRCAYP